ncbi:hypothetical protein V2I49_16975 [Pseudomonas viridiflava]|uniref:hypothetical protein n=1 Tax=Pseudomonas viridiflava TaxID=33069 RepID=UPI002EC76C7F|nr:hypothetical protein [Pseudomonas viridiflava]
MTNDQQALAVSVLNPVPGLSFGMWKLKVMNVREKAERRIDWDINEKSSIGTFIDHAGSLHAVQLSDLARSRHAS